MIRSFRRCGNAPGPTPQPPTLRIRLPDHPDTTEPDSCAQVFACTTNPRSHPDDPPPGPTRRPPAHLRHRHGAQRPGTPPHLRVRAIDVLDTALLTTLGATVLECYDIYVLVFDADRHEVPVFTTTGRWVGEAATPDAVGHLIHAFENTTPRT
ncbi:hypothetical protein AB0O39_27530 [Streptomyces anulatus]|uniref:hypothetical protein n=1 Tax=Streptomyces anulatus TaxID=1892 RepID=UPI0034174861